MHLLTFSQKCFIIKSNLLIGGIIMLKQFKEFALKGNVMDLALLY